MTQKKTTPKQTEKQAQMRKGAANNDGSISQQAAQAMLGSTSCATHMRRALLEFADYVYTECYQRERGGEEKVHILLFSVAVQTTRNVKKKSSKQEQVLFGDATTQIELRSKCDGR